jgi:hypothetical protein
MEAGCEAGNPGLSIFGMERWMSELGCFYFGIIWVDSMHFHNKYIDDCKVVDAFKAFLILV